MENFQVSARKYRPGTFASVVGQEHVTSTLKNAISSSQLAQAFLFSGPRGVGKTTCARILAKAINCQNLTETTEPCGECDSCKSFAKNSSLNIYELDAASNNSVQDIRNLVDQVRYPPQVGKYKVYIIDEVHMLSQAAFNAFLKTLEEPPSYAIFILATTEKHKILPTILSRCQIFDFNRIAPEAIVSHLEDIAGQEKINYEPEALHVIAQKSEGCLRDALSIFDLITTYSTDRHIRYAQTLENLHVLDYDYYFKITDAMQLPDLAQVLNVYDQILRKGFEGRDFLAGLMQHFRNLLVAHLPGTVALIDVPKNVQQKYAETGRKLDYQYLLNALNLCNEFENNYAASKNPRLHVELCLIKITHLPDVVKLLEEAQAQKKK